MKSILQALTLSAMLMAAAGNTYAAAPSALPPGVRYEGNGVWVITPHTSSPDDPQRIQAVVDMAAPGDTVRLEAGVFDFSEFETVGIDKDLTIEGAWDPKTQSPRTTIRNGYYPILIGRKTPIEKPALVTVNGHSVFHITQDVYGKLHYPFLYPPYTAPGAAAYDIFDDWVAVRANVRQIRFERPYGGAVFSSAQNGGVIERNQIHSGWPLDVDTEDVLPIGIGIGWLNMAIRPISAANLGFGYDPRLYTDTDLVRGDIAVQDNVIDGDFRVIPIGETDEAGDVVVVEFDPSNPAPPGGSYDRYVLQDVAFERNPWPTPDPTKIRQHWVKKGYTAYYFYWWDGRVWAERGVTLGVYSLWSEASLTIRRNVLQGNAQSVFLIENGFKGKSFNSVIEQNVMTPMPWGGEPFFGNRAVIAHDYPVLNPVTDEWLVPSPGTNMTFRNNDVKVTSEYLDPFWWNFAVDVNIPGKAIVEQNNVRLASGHGIGLFAPTTGALVSGNQVAGKGNFALATFLGSNGNRLQGNNVNGFEATGAGIPAFGIPAAPVLLISDHNVVVGGGVHRQYATVLDLGVDNAITGMTTKIGQHLTAAQMATLREVKRRSGR